MTEQVTLTLPDSLAQRVNEVATLTQRSPEEVLLEWLHRGSLELKNSSGSLEAIAPSSQTQQSQTQNSAPSESRYPLRGLPLQMSEDFDAPLPELWESLGE